MKTEGKFVYPDVGDHIFEFDVHIDIESRNTVYEMHEYIVCENRGSIQRSRNRRYTLESVETGRKHVRIVGPLNGYFATNEHREKTVRYYKYWSASDDFAYVASFIKENLKTCVESAAREFEKAKKNLEKFEAFENIFEYATIWKQTQMNMREVEERR